MALGLGVLRLPPREFWAMSLPELQSAARGLSGEILPAAPLGRAELDDLMRRFPDETKI